MPFSTRIFSICAGLLLVMGLYACDGSPTEPKGTSVSPPVESTALTTPETLPEQEPPQETVIPDPLPVYSWKTEYEVEQSIAQRIAPPQGFQRVEAASGSFGEWLRHLPLKPGRPDVLLYNGSLKGYQDAHHAVIDMDVGTRDLQQCADAVMRVRAEYLYTQERYSDIHFNFVSGATCDWDRWRAGKRPRVTNSSTTWSQKASADDSYPNFKKYLIMVYNYAGTASLTKELTPVTDPGKVEIGDVFIWGGFPGHAVIVVDVAEQPETGERMFMIAQSYMPAQEMHVLVNPNDPDLSPWYSADLGDQLATPEWNFSTEDLKRF